MVHHILPETLNSQKIQHCFSVYTILSKLLNFLVFAKLFIQWHLPILEEYNRRRWLKLVFLFPRTELPQLMLHTAPSRSHDLLWKKSKIQNSVPRKDNTLLNVRETVKQEGFCIQNIPTWWMLSFELSQAWLIRVSSLKRKFFLSKKLHL